MKKVKKKRLFLCLMLVVCMAFTNQSAFATITGTIGEDQSQVESQVEESQTVGQSIETEPQMKTGEAQETEPQSVITESQPSESEPVQSEFLGQESVIEESFETNQSEMLESDDETSVNLLNGLSVTGVQDEEVMRKVSIRDGHITKINGVETSEKLDGGDFIPGTVLEIAADNVNSENYTGAAFKKWNTKGCIINTSDVFSTVISVTIPDISVNTPDNMDDIIITAKQVAYLNGTEAVLFDNIRADVISVDGLMQKANILFGSEKFYITVGSTITLEAPETDDEGNPFLRWHVGYISNTNLDYSDKVFEDKSQRIAKMTVLPEMNAAYTDHCEVHPIYDTSKKSVQLSFNDAVVESSEGNVQIITEDNKVYYNCEAGSVLHIKWDEKKDDVFKYRFKGWRTVPDIKSPFMVNLFDNEKDDHTTIRITPELTSLLSPRISIFGDYVRYQDEDLLCKVHVENGKILSVDGIETDEYNVSAQESEPYAEGYFKPGTTLVVESLEESTWLWGAFDNYSNLPFDTEYVDVGYFQTSTRFERVVTYVVPEALDITLRQTQAAWGDGPITVYVTNGQIIGSNDMLYDSPLLMGKYDHGQIIKVQAVAPKAPEGADFKYVFDHWEGYDGYPLRFYDKNAEITEVNTQPYPLPYVKLIAIFKKVPVESGIIDVVPAIGKDAPMIYISKDDVENCLLTDEEREQMARGANIIITASINVKATASDDENRLIDQYLGSYVQGQIWDIEFFKQIEDGDSIKLDKTLKPMLLMMNIPDAYKTSGGNRKFILLRIHDGVCTILEDLDSNLDTITVESDLYSTYVLMYKDEIAETQESTEETQETTKETVEDTKESSKETIDETQESVTESSTNQTDESKKETEQKPTNNSQSSDKTNTNAPKTGDSTPIVILMSLFVVSAVVVSLIFIKRRSKKHC